MPDDDRIIYKARIARGASLAGLLLLLAAVMFGIRQLRRDDSGPAAALVAEPAPTPVAKPPPVSQAYVGSHACRECHRDIWERYQSHPMAHSMSRVDDGEPMEDYADHTQFSRGLREYRVEHIGERVFHHEQQRDLDGEVIYDQGVEVDYALGSGAHGRSYLIDREGILFVSPIAWYSQAGRWDLSPGYAEDKHQRFERRVTDRCISCHAGRVAPDPQWADRFKQPPVLEFGIGCERCHGPGGGHVARHGSAEPMPGDDPIVNPARLATSQRDSVCYQCHLHGDDEVLRYGRTDFDFRPGMQVADVWSIVQSDRGKPAGEATAAVSQVQQLLSSMCATKSGGRLGCISCHDPHSRPAESDKAAFFREKCVACHAISGCREPIERRQRPPIADSCIVCHMPRLAASDVPHLAQTDHRIPRFAGKPAIHQFRQQSHRQVESSLFEPASPGLSDMEQARWKGVLLARSAELTRNRTQALRAQQILEPVVGSMPDDRWSCDALAMAWALGDRQDSAIKLWKRLLRTPPLDESTLQSLASVFEKQGKNDQALECLDRLIAVDRWIADYWAERSRLLKSAGRTDEALTAARRAAQIDPASIEHFRRIKEICRELGLSDEASRAQQMIDRLDRR